MTTATEERAQIVERARKLREDIRIEFNTIAYWNRHVRKPDEEPIDPDPDGALGRIAHGLDRMLKHENERQT